MAETTVRIESVRVTNRYRTDLGDVQALADSIRESGLLHAIVVTPDMRLVAGQRRLEAARSLGWTVIDARVVDNLEDATALLIAERAENTQRKAMLPSELAALAHRLHEIETENAKRRQGERTDIVTPVSQSEPGRAREKVGEALGIGGTTAGNLVRVHRDATEGPTAQVRESARQALKEMDATGHIRPATDRHRERTGSGVSAGVAREQSRMSKAGEQRKTIENLITRLDSIAFVIDHIGDIAPEISGDETARWADSLIKARSPLTTLINRLRKHTT